MKKMVCVLISIFLFLFVACDRSHLCSLDVLCSNENISIVVDGEYLEKINFLSRELNSLPLENYSQIDFTSYENNSANVKMYKFDIVSLTNDTYNLSLKLVETNKYVVDFLRIGIIVDDELRVYKYYDKYENLYHKENDPDSILHFTTKSEIFNELAVNFSTGETKEIIVFIWIEESELYDKKGERYKGWADNSYKASPIILRVEVE